MKDDPRFGDAEELQRDPDDLPHPFRPVLVRAVVLLTIALLLMKCVL